MAAVVPHGYHTRLSCAMSVCEPDIRPNAFISVKLEGLDTPTANNGPIHHIKVVEVSRQAGKSARKREDPGREEERPHSLQSMEGKRQVGVRGRPPGRSVPDLVSLLILARIDPARKVATNRTPSGGAAENAIQARGTRGGGSDECGACRETVAGKRSWDVGKMQNERIVLAHAGQ